MGVGGNVCETRPHSIWNSELGHRQLDPAILLWDARQAPPTAPSPSPTRRVYVQQVYPRNKQFTMPKWNIRQVCFCADDIGHIESVLVWEYCRWMWVIILYGLFQTLIYIHNESKRWETPILLMPVHHYHFLCPRWHNLHQCTCVGLCPGATSPMDCIPAGLGLFIQMSNSL